MGDGTYRLVGILSIILFVIFLSIIAMTSINLFETNDAINRYGRDSELENVRLTQVLILGVVFTLLLIVFAAILFFLTQKTSKILAIGTLIVFAVALFFIFAVDAISVGYTVNSPSYRGGATDFNIMVIVSSLVLFLSFIFLVIMIMFAIYLGVKKEAPKSLLALAKG